MKIKPLLALFLLSILLPISSTKVPEYPKFILKSPDGAIFKPENLRGKAVFLTFFSKGCKPCMREAPFLNELMDRYPDTLIIIAVGFMENDPEALKAIGEKWGVRYTICLDPGGLAAGVFGVNTLPRGFLLNHEGRVVADYTGMSEKNKLDLTDRINELDRIIKSLKKSDLSFWVEPRFTVIEGDVSLGIKWAEIIKNIIAKEFGRSIASSREEADYIIGGKVLDMEDTLAVEIIISNGSGVKVTSFAVTVTDGDDSSLRDVLKYRLDALR